ncbi:MAG TPA: imidazole glycerol phosphate synthase subunit HisH [Longimicrobiaceae bacterium]|nr:imidazole glycerol phosphate synthase subunit HisH [Longimicrobiaceae bacterium]
MIAIVDYGMGNLGSIANMLRKVGSEGVITSDPERIAAAEKLILPGVGHFGAGMRALGERGLIPVLNRKALDERVPVLGICLGMQLLTRHSEEGDAAGLGWIDADTVRFRFAGEQARMRVPHMGWNGVRVERESPLFPGGADEETRFYFVHSYYVRCHDADAVLAHTSYGHPFVSAVQKGNVMGAQFHPEKSHRYGMSLLRGFAEAA